MTASKHAEKTNYKCKGKLAGATTVNSFITTILVLDREINNNQKNRQTKFEQDIS